LATDDTVLDAITVKIAQLVAYKTSPTRAWRSRAPVASRR